MFFDLFLLDFISLKNLTEDTTLTLPPGSYTITLNGAAGGPGCEDGKYTSTGGKGAQIRFEIKTIDNVSFNFIIGKQPSTNCIAKNYGGYPDGGNSGEDTGASKDDTSGAGGGSTSIYFNSTPLAKAAGGAGGCNDLNGSDGGGIGYVLKVIDDEGRQNISTNEYFLSGTRGGDGENYAYTPGAGGGHGWHGGVGGGQAYTSHYKAAAAGGMSGYEPLNNPYIYMDSTPDVKDGRYTENTGSGNVIIETNYVCIDGCKKCYDDKSCLNCFDDYELFENRCNIKSSITKPPIYHSSCSCPEYSNNNDRFIKRRR